jgi:hypothetical protein
MKHIYYSAFLLTVMSLSVFGLSTSTTHAYFTTGQKVVPLENGASLFVIDYKFGHEKHEIQLPIMATTSSLKATNTVSYEIIDKDGHIIPGKVSAIALSNARLGEDKMYSIPKNTAKKFTLIAVFIPTDRSAEDDHRLQVTHLPFNFDRKQQLQLNPSELKYYTTPYTDL